MSATPQQSAIRDLVVGEEPLTIEKFAGKSDPSAADVLAMTEKLGVRMVDLKFTDVPGTWQHMTLSVSALEEDAFSDGLGFDGSSIRGFQQIAESDMLLMPDASDGEDRPLLRRADAVADLQRDRPDHARGLLARSAIRRAEGRAAPPRERRSPTPRSSARRPSSTSSTTSPSTRKHTRPTTRSTTPRRTGTGARDSETRIRSPTSATIRARRRATSRSPRWTRWATCAR